LLTEEPVEAEVVVVWDQGTAKPQVTKIDVGLYMLSNLWIPGLSRATTLRTKQGVHPPIRASDVSGPSGVESLSGFASAMR